MALPSEETILEHLKYIISYNLFANNKEEFGNLIGFPSLKDNSINKLPKGSIQPAYTKLDRLVFLYSQDMMDLPTMMEDFIKCADFFKNNDLKRLAAFKEKEKSWNSAMQITERVFGNHDTPSNPKIEAVCSYFYSAENGGWAFDPSALILLILGIIRNEKDGASSLDDDFNDMCSFATIFFVDHTLYGNCPLIEEGRQKFNRPEYHNRLFLLYLFDSVLMLAEKMANDYNSVINKAQDMRFFLDLDLGEDLLWRDDEHTMTYFMFVLHENLTYTLTSLEVARKEDHAEVRYSIYEVHFFNNDDGTPALFIIHPRGRDSLYKGDKLNESDRAWFNIEANDRYKPSVLKLTPRITPASFDFSKKYYPGKMTLRQMSKDESDSVWEILNREDTISVNQWAEYAVEFFEGVKIRAITPEGLYISNPFEEEESYFCISAESLDGMEKLALSDNVEIYYLANEDNYFLAIHGPVQLNLNISTEEDRKENGITIVDHIS